MGQMQDTLEQLLCSQFRSVGTKLPFPTRKDIVGSTFGTEIQRVYKALGGELDCFPLNLRAWDMEFDGVAIELDEYLHFNRYRAITLDSPIYAGLPSFPADAYRRYCSDHESWCLRAGGYGGKWSNSSCVKQFGKASPEKDLNGNGAPRWKQRAFYDFVKDHAPLLVRVPLVRIAIWDTVVERGNMRPVEEVLLQPSPHSAAALATLVKERQALTFFAI